jgi:sugar lactone lactonase YvrE
VGALVVAGVLPASSSGSSVPRIGSVSLFAQIGAPGHPFGVLATSDAVYAATSVGAPFRPNDGTERVLRFTPHGKPAGSATVTTMQSMGLHNMAEDGDGRVYVVDMNSRILRFTPGPRGLGSPEVYATVPEPYASAGWEASMWQGLAFDSDGCLYVTDASLGAIWRIPPGGDPAIWFQAPELMSSQISGVNGIAVGPDHQLYVVLAGSPLPNHFGNGIVYRLPLQHATPDRAELQLFHEFAVQPSGRPLPFPVAGDLVFGQSGNAYVTLTSTNQVAVVDKQGREVRLISDPRFDVPIGITMQGNSLLLANSNYFPPENEAHWQLLKVYVGEPALPLIRPHVG